MYGFISGLLVAHHLLIVALLYVLKLESVGVPISFFVKIVLYQSWIWVHFAELILSALIIFAAFGILPLTSSIFICLCMFVYSFLAVHWTSWMYTLPSRLGAFPAMTPWVSSSSSPASGVPLCVEALGSAPRFPAALSLLSLFLSLHDLLCSPFTDFSASSDLFIPSGELHDCCSFLIIWYDSVIFHSLLPSLCCPLALWTYLWWLLWSLSLLMAAGGVQQPSVAGVGACFPVSFLPDHFCWKLDTFDKKFQALSNPLSFRLVTVTCLLFSDWLDDFGGLSPTEGSAPHGPQRGSWWCLQSPQPVVLAVSSLDPRISSQMPFTTNCTTLRAPLGLNFQSSVTSEVSPYGKRSGAMFYSQASCWETPPL